MRWWIRFFVGPIPLRIALFVAFVAIAVAVWEATALKDQADTLGAQHVQLRSAQQRADRDRNAAIFANVRARRDDCEKVNGLRGGLRQVVTEARQQVPLIVRTFPQLPKEYLRAQDRLYRDELRDFADDDCRAYALDALPPADRSRIPPNLFDPAALPKRLVLPNLFG